MEKSNSSDVQVFLNILTRNGAIASVNEKDEIEAFVTQDSQSKLIALIKESEEQLMSTYRSQRRINDISLQSWTIPNATAGKDYIARLDVKALKIEDLIIHGILGLADFGLTWGPETQTISGTPTIAGTAELDVQYTLRSQSKNEVIKNNSKKMHFIVNPDPKTLWKNIPSNTEAPFWKEDNAMDAARLGERNLVVCSKRGRSHQHKGTFRDDHYSFKHYAKNGWSVVAVSDGAGSAKYSREGAKVACDAIVDHFQRLSESQEDNALMNLDKMLTAYDDIPAQEDVKALTNHSKKTLLYPAAVYAHEALKNRASEIAEAQPELFKSDNLLEQLNDFHATLIFCLFKKFKFGYVLLSFGVGDCPIAVAYADEENSAKVMLLNILDVGEYGGGTRFITQPRIFGAKAEIPMAKRFAMNVISDFNFLFLMTDGIYDPKFEVEANLEKPTHWVEFVKDLHGKNEDEAKVEFNPGNPNINEQLSIWMDFFSKGNHDDRTLAVVY